MMVNKGMDVKELVSSQLFYATIWEDLSLFSSVSEPVIIPYNDQVEDLDFEDPNVLFKNATKVSDQGFNLVNLSDMEKNLMSSRQSYYDGLFKGKQKNARVEEYEMQYNYINMEQIQGEKRVSFSKVMKDCEDLVLFEQESIQHIIDYKWKTYGYNFFLLKFVLYFVFLVFYYIDLESIHTTHEDGKRIKDPQYYFCKLVCSLIQLIFFLYELFQIKNEGSEYF